MKKQLVKRVMSCMIATIMFTACFAIPVFAEQKVKVSDTNYTVDMDGASNFSNATAQQATAIATISITLFITGSSPEEKVKPKPSKNAATLSKN